jgi:hypothetical protein
MFNKTKEAAEIAKESVFFDLRRLRRRVLDGFMERSIKLENSIAKMYHPENKSIAEIQYKSARSVWRFRQSVWSLYRERYGQQDDLDYQHIAMEVLVEEMRSHGFPLPIDDHPAQGYGNFPTDGIFRQGTD